MTFLPPIPRPERADGTVLAALLSALLALMVVAQFALPPERPVVPDMPAPAIRPQTHPIKPVRADPVLARQTLFQPTSPAGGGIGAPTGPLDGAVPAGIVRVRGAARLVLQTPNGSTVTLRTGQAWQGWRLIEIGRDEVRFARGSENVTMGLGNAQRYSYPGYARPAYDPRGSAGKYRPNQAEEQ